MTLWFRGIRARLLWMIVLPMLIMAPLGFFTFRMMGEQDDQIREFMEVHLPQSTIVSQMGKDFQGIMRSLWCMFGAEDDLQDRQASQAKVDAYLKELQELRAKFEELSMDDAERAQWNGVTSGWDSAIGSIQEAESLFARATKEGDESGRLVLFKQVRPALVPIEKGLAAINEQQVKDVDELGAAAVQKGETIRRFVLAGSWIGVLMIAVLGVIFARTLSRRFSEIAHHVATSADEVGSASSQLSVAGQRFSAGSSEAASSLEETVASLEELSAMVKANAGNSKEAGALSQQARAAAERGEGEVHQLVQAIGEISTSSRKIEEIINVIDDIAFQTNLLALNAAVEAARAGEQGRGFAVVAEAVRTLAQRSSEAARDINVLIKESVTKVDRGTQLADRSGEVLGQIVSSSKKVADLTTEIAQASEEQSSGLAQISGAMNQLDQATQSNAASAEETAATAEELSAEAENLRVQVHALMALVDGVSKAQGRGQTSARTGRVARRTLPAVIPLDETEAESAPASTGTHGF